MLFPMLPLAAIGELFAGILPLIIIGVIFGALRGAGVMGSGPALVLKEFNISDGRDGNYVRIVGRPKGILGWILSVTGLAEDWTFIVTARSVERKAASLNGRMYDYVPIENVASSHCGYARSIGLLIVGIIIGLGGLIGGLAAMAESGAGGAVLMFFGLIIGAVCIVYFFLSRSMKLSVITTGGTTVGLTFDRSVIENVAVDFNKVEVVISIINELVSNMPGKKISVPLSSGFPVEPARPGAVPPPMPPAPPPIR